MVEVVYEKEILKHDLLENSFLGIDLGLNNFVTALDNQAQKSFYYQRRSYQKRKSIF